MMLWRGGVTSGSSLVLCLCRWDVVSYRMQDLYDEWKDVTMIWYSGIDVNERGTWTIFHSIHLVMRMQCSGSIWLRGSIHVQKWKRGKKSKILYMLAVWWLCSASQTDKAYDYRGCIKIPQFYVIALEYRGTLQMEEWQVSIISCSWYAIGVDKCGQVRSSAVRWVWI